ncbi:MAG TPA: 5'-3' exonuclease H3TH domain-containing protein [Candidatus Nitrosocosmicus sp.]|nr:5'-3' exonuclease H3TH domain-containing protein [Candidatus Nitrosocosmicus sp.]
MNKKLLLIDGNALIHRAYHAYPSFLSYNGSPTNAVYGFATLLQKAIQNFSPHYVVVCFDRPEPTFRKKLYTNYQIQRPAPEQNLISQFQLVRDFLDAAHITRYELAGFEADDIIGTISCHLQTKNIHVLILTGDKDILQLVNEHVSVITPRKGLEDIVIYNEEAVEKRFNIKPNQIPDLKGLMGDPSDNYPGVAGIGPKTAATLINQFGSVENIYNNLDEVKNPKTKELLIKYKEDALMSKNLATILCDMKVELNIETCEFNGYGDDLKNFFEELKFKSLIPKFFPKISVAEQKKAEQKKTIEKKDPSDQMGLF